jgi:hypothetical protein
MRVATPIKLAGHGRATPTWRGSAGHAGQRRGEERGKCHLDIGMREHHVRRRGHHEQYERGHPRVEEPPRQQPGGGQQGQAQPQVQELPGARGGAAHAVGQREQQRPPHREERGGIAIPAITLSGRQAVRAGIVDLRVLGVIDERVDGEGHHRGEPQQQRRHHHEDQRPCGGCAERHPMREAVSPSPSPERPSRCAVEFQSFSA